jgi:hypothetical protein
MELAPAEYLDPVRTSYSRHMPLIFKAFLVAAVLGCVNFFLTPIPYLAEHGAATGTEIARAIYGHWWINFGIVVVAAVAISAVLWVRSVRASPVIFFILGGLLVSGMVTGAIFTHPQSYALDVVGFTFVALAAGQDSIRSLDDDSRIGLFASILLIPFIAGLALAIAFPGKYGDWPYTFSRVTRGEVTLWLVLGLHILIPALAVTLLAAGHRFRWIFLAAGLLCVVTVAGTYTRSATTAATLPFLFYLLYRFRAPWQRALLAVAIATVLFSGTVTDWFLAGQATSINDLAHVTTGRWPLWTFHFSKFLESPLYGWGLLSVITATNYDMHQALVEVGALTWFSQNGLIYGIPMLFLLTRAVWRAVVFIIVGRRTVTPLDFFCSVVVLSMFPAILAESDTRIALPVEIVLYGAIFYLNSLSMHSRPPVVAEQVTSAPTTADEDVAVYAGAGWN